MVNRYTANGGGRRWCSRAGAILVAGVVVMATMAVVELPVAAAQPPVGDAIVEPPPPPDDFYDSPTDLATFPPGEIIRSRPVDVTALQLLPMRVQAWQLLYRTTDADGAPDAAVTTVMIPEGPAKPRPLLSFQAATDSTLRVCNPSYGLTHGAPIDFSDPTGPITFPLPAAEMALAAVGLSQGWAVTMPDHGSLDSRFLTPRQPGFAVLDGIRATESFEPVALDGSQTPTVMWGYSGGAIATSWAIEEQPTYAPELNIEGAAIGAPERDLEASLKAVNGTPLAGLIPIALSAISKDSPEFATALDKYLTPRGKAVIDATRSHCAPQNILNNLWFRYEDALVAPVDQVLADPVIRREIDARGISDRTPTVPVYVYNGITEEVAPIEGTDKLVDAYCAGGAAVTYRRVELPPNPIPQLSSTHGIVVGTDAPGAFNWLKQRLAPGAPTPTGCDVKTVPTTLLDPGSLDMVGPMLGTFLGVLTGAPLGSGH